MNKLDSINWFSRPRLLKLDREPWYQLWNTSNGSLDRNRSPLLYQIETQNRSQPRSEKSRQLCRGQGNLYPGTPSTNKNASPGWKAIFQFFRTKPGAIRQTATETVGHRCHHAQVLWRRVSLYHQCWGNSIIIDNAKQSEEMNQWKIIIQNLLFKVSQNTDSMPPPISIACWLKLSTRNKTAHIYPS